MAYNINYSFPSTRRSIFPLQISQYIREILIAQNNSHSEVTYIGDKIVVYLVFRNFRG